MTNKQRVCFMLQVKPDRLEEYRLRHASVWPTMIEALQRTGWHNYSLFLTPRGELIGYLETDDFQLAQKKMRDEPVNQLWQAEMRRLLRRNRRQRSRPAYVATRRSLPHRLAVPHRQANHAGTKTQPTPYLLKQDRSSLRYVDLPAPSPSTRSSPRHHRP